MADRIKGITIEIGGDTQGLSKALSGVNKEIKSTESQLKDVERLLKLDPTNTKLLEQRQRLLGQAVAETREKLDTLREAERQAQEQFERGEISREQYEGLQREIVATEQSLEALEKRAEQSNAVLCKISASADALSESAGKVSNATKGISTGAAAGLGSLAALAVQAGATADDLNTLAKQSGFTTEQLQIWQYGADRVDVAMEDIVSAAAKMKKNMISTSAQVTEAWTTLGVSVVDANGELRDSTEVFDEAVAALSRVENETERDTLAMTLFGKSADSLAGLLDDGGEAFREYGEEAKEAGLILSQDALDSANEFNDAVDKLKAQATGTFASLGAEMATMLIPVMEKVGEVASDLIAWIKGLDEKQLKMIVTVLALVAAISPVAGIISGVASAVSTLSSGIMFLIANPVVLLIAAIVALVALIATKGDEIQAVLQKVDDFLQNIFVKDWTQAFGPWLGEALNTFFANVKNIWDSIKRIFDGIIDFIRGVFTGDWSRAWEGVKKIFSGVFSALTSVAKAPINAVIGLINGAIGGINQMIKALNKIKFSIPSWVPGLGGKSFGFNIGTVSKIPYLAKGGILASGSAIVGEAGPELLTVANGRAVVQPLSNNGVSNSVTTDMGGITINVNAAPGQSVNAIADAVMRRMEHAVAQKEAVW